MTFAFRIVAALGAILFAGYNIWFNIQSLADLDGQGAHVVHNAAGLSGYALLVGIPMLMLAWRPRQVALLRLVVAAGLATVLGGLRGGVLLSSLLIAVAFVIVLVLLSPDRAGVFRLGSPSIPLVALVFIAAIPLVVEALRQADLQGGQTSGDEHLEFLHYAGMAIAYFAILLGGFVSAFPGRAVRTARLLVGLAGVWLAAIDLLYPDALGTVDRHWAAAGLVLSVVYLVYGYIEVGRRSTEAIPE
jgi:hypothetical protein